EFDLYRVEFSGNNIATYSAEIGGVVNAKKRTYFGGNLFGAFPFEGLTIAAGQVVRLRVIHSRPLVGDFEGRILGALTDA
ncbi:MAG: hypothetical protein GTO02_21595, partial [Candidatus Dadabacteria bacterium]|nr:hypothetical protein [Candidatus Dadabacteria bacterium]